jgi:hypothetical protein
LIFPSHKTKERIQSAGGEWQSAGLKLGIDALVFKGKKNSKMRHLFAGRVQEIFSKGAEVSCHSTNLLRRWKKKMNSWLLVNA